MFASSEDEWVEKLSRLIESPDLRKELGGAGRVTVEKDYSAAVQAPRVYSIFESVVSGSRERRAALAESRIIDPAGQ